MANDALTNPDIAERIVERKQKVVDALAEMPIVLHACRKTGVSPAPFYRWQAEDRQFWLAAKKGMDRGIEYVNDLTEIQLIALIKEKKMPAIALWLKHHHKRYGVMSPNSARQRRSRAPRRLEAPAPAEGIRRREELKVLARNFHDFLKKTS